MKLIHFMCLAATLLALLATCGGTKAPKAAALPKDLAKSGLKLGEVFPLKGLKLEKVEETEETRMPGHTGYQGHYCVFDLDEKGRLIFYVVASLAYEPEYHADLSRIEPIAYNLGGTQPPTMVEMTTSEVKAAYGPPSQEEESWWKYCFDLHEQGFVEITFMFVPRDVHDPKSPLVVWSVSGDLKEGHSAETWRSIAKDHGRKIYQWPL